MWSMKSVIFHTEKCNRGLSMFLLYYECILFSLSYISLIGCTSVWIDSSFRWPTNEPTIWILTYIFLCRHKISFGLGKYLIAVSLNCMIRVYLTLQKTANCWKVAVPFWLAINNVWEFQLLHSLVSSGNLYFVCLF